MDINDYIGVLNRRWWVLALALVIVLSGTYFWTSNQTRIYESRATFVIRPRPEVRVLTDYIRALDMISNRTEINATFADVATSQLIQNRAMDKMNLSPQQRQGLVVGGGVVGGANILELTVESPDPVLAHDFADVVGGEIVNYTNGLYDVYQLESLDAATTPSKPIRPTVTLNMTLGAFLGLALGVSLIFLMEMTRPTHDAEEVKPFLIIDRETGAYNKSYLAHRLFQEMARARRTRSPLSLGLVKVNFDGDGFSEAEQIEALRMMRILAEKAIREEDILARFNGAVFAIVFPDSKPDQAQESLEKVRQVIGSVAHDMDDTNGQFHIDSRSSVVSYSGRDLDQETFLNQAYTALASLSSSPERLDV